MAARHVVVDGSNLATEGRSMPSLAQLDQAVREFLLENPEDVVTVVVDASFGHRIDSGESKIFEEAEAAGELVSPPAGAIGRGDAFLLRIADKTGATVLSNDSFQEFHGDYDWLFERGRLIGGKPVPGVGWIFTPRTPVRGPRSREAVKEAKRKTKGEPESAMPGLDLAAERSRTKGKGKKIVERAIAVALEEAVAPKDKPRRRRKGGSPPAEPVNDPLSFITFIAAHPLGAEVTATVESFASHGAFVDCGGARCYVPLSAMGDPPPKSAREIFGKGQQVTFVVQALDPQRRGVELALPGFAKVAGAPTDETVEAEIGAHEDDDVDSGLASLATAVAPPRARRSRTKAMAAPGSPAPPQPAESETPAPPVMKAPSRRRGPATPEVPVPENAAVEVSATEAPVKKAPSRRRGPAASAGPTAGPAPDAAVADAPVKKAPSRRRGPARAPSVPEGAEGPAPETPVPETPAPEVPVKKTPSRRRAEATAAAPSPQAQPMEPVARATPPAGEELPTMAGPRRRSSSRAETSEAKPPATAAAAAVPAVDAAPAPSTRPASQRGRTGASPGPVQIAPVPAVDPTKARGRSLPAPRKAQTGRPRTGTSDAVPSPPSPPPSPPAPATNGDVGGAPSGRRRRGRAAEATKPSASPPPAEAPPVASNQSTVKKAARPRRPSSSD